MKPMLAATVENVADLKFPLLASPKLDGVRAIVLNGVVVSRKLEPFPNPQVHRMFDDPRLNRLDGEIIVGNATDPQVRNTTSGAMNRKVSPELSIAFHAFDFVDTQEPYSARLEAVNIVAKYNTNIVVVEQTLVENAIALIEFENDCLDMGYEGVMLRDPEGPYKHGRSTLREGWLMKLKRFADGEAVVLEVNEEMQNTNKAKKDKLGRTKRSKAQAGLVGKGRAGELRVVGMTAPFEGVEFIVPLGAAGDEGKAWWWAMRRRAAGLVITVKYFLKGVKDKPLLPIYVGVRPGWDRS